MMVYNKTLRDLLLQQHFFFTQVRPQNLAITTYCYSKKSYYYKNTDKIVFKI